ncbi:MAG: hypothetical protein GX605_00725 [Chloroflexi bacterium]|nr:hypothetical protein [Chloroflexota bacterium]
MTARSEDAANVRGTAGWLYIILSLALMAVLLWLTAVGTLAEGRPGLGAAASSAQGPVVKVLPAAALIYPVGTTTTVGVWVEDVEGLYGIDIRLSHDPEVLTVPSGQVKPLWDVVDSSNQFIVKNTADNSAGTIWHALASINPAVPFSGTGRVCSIAFNGEALGLSALRFTYAKASDRHGNPIWPAMQGGSVEALAAPPADTPTPTETGPVVDTATPTATASETPSPTPTATGTDVVADTAPPTPTGDSPDTATPTATARSTDAATPTQTRTPSDTATPTATATLLPASGAVAGVVYFDANENQVQDPFEPPLAGAEISLWTTEMEQVRHVVTGADGQYLFFNLAPQHYTLREVNPPGYALSTTPDEVSVLILASQTLAVNFGDTLSPGTATPTATATATTTATPTATATPTETPLVTDTPTATATATPTHTPIPGFVAGYIWEDLSADWQMDPGEGPLSGVRVGLLPVEPASQTSQLQPLEAWTELDGWYFFSNVPPGRYVVTGYPPGDYFVVTDRRVPISLQSDDLVLVYFGMRPIYRQRLPLLLQQRQ